MKMRWQIVEPKRKIASTSFEGHRDDVEMSGEQVSAIVSYGVQDGVLTVGSEIVYPMFRVQPNNTHGSYITAVQERPLDVGKELFDRVELDGTLHLFAHTECLQLEHVFFPSTTLPIFYEQITVTNCSKVVYPLDVCESKRLEMRLGCRGYIVTECLCEQPSVQLQAGDSVTLLFAYVTRFANEDTPKEEEPLQKRRLRVKTLLEECDLTTGNDVLDTMFAFAKLRSGESLFRTRGGLVHSPGGLRYYAAVWCNDQCEYATPWFAYTGDELEREATLTAFRWYEPYMNDEYRYIPSSIIAEGTDFWAGARDRGDAAMYAFGLSSFLLTRGELPTENQEKAIDWCVEYTLRQITEDGVVRSDYDELEGRLSSGINLNTSSLAYGAFRNLSVLYRRMNRVADAEKMEREAEKLHQAIERYFGQDIAGYHTYQYHAGCDVIRAWTCLPIYMGIHDRARETADAISDKLWVNGSIRTTEGEKILWDRSALYYLTSLFRMGDAERGYEKLMEYAQTRLLGERVPYAVEAYPENNMRHLAGESALFCRVIVEGLLNITASVDGPVITPQLPKEIPGLQMNRIFLNGKYRNITVQNGKVTMQDA